MTREQVADLVIDCDGCAVRGLACDDCVVTVLLGEGSVADDPAYDEPVQVDAVEARALAALADGGLVPPLRLTPRTRAG